MLAVVSVLLIAACATPGNRQSSSNAPTITVEEIQENAARNAYDLIRNIRPGWLRPRARVTLSGATPVAVYLDGVRTGGPEALYEVQTQQISAANFLDGPSATQRFGTDHGGGAILITTR